MEYNEEAYTEKALQFIYEEANKHFNEITHSFRVINNASYALMAFLFPLLGYLLSKIFQNNSFCTIESCLFLMLLLPLSLLILNLLPIHFIIAGAEPVTLNHEYFRTETKRQYKRLLIQRIEDIQKAIMINGNALDKRAKRFRIVIILLSLSFAITFILWFLYFRS